MENIIHSDQITRQAVKEGSGSNAATSDDPKYSIGYNNLGVLKTDRSSLEDAFTYLFNAYKLDPANRPTLIKLSEVLRALNKDKEANEILSIFLNSNPKDLEIIKLLEQDQDEELVSEKALGNQGYVISAIVSTYDSDQFIAGRLDDLLSQTLAAKVEIIIVDSCSPGNEQKIVADYQQRYTNIKYLRTDIRETIYQAWNRGIRISTAPYVTNANTDDRLRPDALEVMVKALENNRDVALVYADYFMTTAPIQGFTGHVRSGHCVRPDFHPSIMNSGCHMGPQPVWRKEIHSCLGYFDESYSSAADYEFWCRIATHYPMLHLNEFLGVYYHNPVGIVNSNTEVSLKETQQIQKRYASFFPIGNAVPVPDYYYQQPWKDNEYVNIGMVTYNRLEYTKQAIKSLITYTRFPHVISIVDNNSQDGTQQYLTQLYEQGVVKNLILLKENIGVAKASNLAWQCEQDAGYYLKCDNDIIIQKPDWLKNLVEVANGVSQLGVVGYNFEPRSYELKNIDGFNIRPKPQPQNVGGACILIPKKTHDRLGFWCEDYGLYGEEDFDYGIRVALSGLLNVYMEDEDIGFHLPAGKAAVIDLHTFIAKDGLEESLDKEYRKNKDSQRTKNMAPGGSFSKNMQAYMNFSDRLYIESSKLGEKDFTLIFPEYLKGKITSLGMHNVKYPVVPISTLLNEHVKGKFKIGILSTDHPKHACFFIRIKSILEHLKQHIDFRTILEIKADQYIVNPTVIDWADIIIIQRAAPCKATQEIVNDIFASGCYVIYDTDDLLTEKLPICNSLSNAFEKHIPYIIDTLKKSNLVTTSTEFLAGIVSQYNKNVRVLPNLLDQNLWQKKQPIADRNIQTILFAGTPTHSGDLELVENCLVKIHEKYKGSVKFIFFGCITPRLSELSGSVYYELVTYKEYSLLLQGISAEIAIIPLQENQFNNSKSNIKWLEFSMCGIAGVYSDVLPYHCIENGKTGLLVNNREDDWSLALEWLIDNPDKRRGIALEAQKKVLENNTLKTGANKNLNAIQSLNL